MKLNRKLIRKMILKEMSSMMSGPPVPMHTQMIDAEMLANNNADFMNACEAITKEGGKALLYLKGGRGSQELMELVKSCKAYLMNIPQVLADYTRVDPSNRGADIHLGQESFIRDRLIAIQKHLKASELVARKSMAVGNMFNKLSKTGRLSTLNNMLDAVLNPTGDGLL